MKHYKVNIIISYEIEAENKEDAMVEAENEFYNNIQPSILVSAEDSWEE